MLRILSCIETIVDYVTYTQWFITAGFQSFEPSYMLMGMVALSLHRESIKSLITTNSCRKVHLDHSPSLMPLKMTQLVCTYVHTFSLIS